MSDSAEPWAFWNGRFLPASQAVVPIYDTGFVQGVTITEQLRTFGGSLYRLPEHLARFEQSLEVVGIDLGRSMRELEQTAKELVARNHRLLHAEDDLGLAIFATPGPYPALAPSAEDEATICLHTYPLPFSIWAEKYEQGCALATTDVRQTPPECWPSRLKCRSRMHYYLADRQAARLHLHARALLLDERGFVTEASTANVFILKANRLVSPPLERVLPGISLAAVKEFAARLEIEFVHEDLLPEDVAAADEVLLTSTPWRLLPVCSFNGAAIATGKPGKMYRKLIAAWNETAGFDLVAQAIRFAKR